MSDQHKQYCKVEDCTSEECHELRDKLEQLPESPQPVGMLSLDLNKMAERSGCDKQDILEHLHHNEIYNLEQIEEEKVTRKRLSCEKLGTASNRNSAYLRMHLDSVEDEEHCCHSTAKLVDIPYHSGVPSSVEKAPQLSQSASLKRQVPSFVDVFNKDKGNDTGVESGSVGNLFEDAVPSALLKRAHGSHEDVYLMSGENLEDPEKAYILPVPHKGEVDAHANMSSDMMMILPEQKQDGHKKNISEILMPSSLEATEVYICEKENSTSVVLKMSYHQHILGYLMLTICMLANASQGSVTVGLKDTVDSIRVCCWRMQSLWMLMTPMFLMELKANWKEVKPLMTNTQLLRTFIIASTAYFIGLSSFYLALHKTSMPHAFLLSNMHCLILVLYKWVCGFPTNFGEFTGTIIAVIGMFTTMIGSLTASPGSAGGSIFDSLLGDFVALCGSFAAATFIVKGKEVRDRMPLYVYLWCLMCVVNVGAVFLSVYTEGSDFSFTDKGVFGWMTSERIVTGLYLGGVTGLMGTMGYIMCMKFVPGVAIAVFMMLEPFTGSIMGVILGVTGMPDIYTIVGGTVLIGGAIMVILYTRDSSEEIDVTDCVNEVDPQFEQPKYMVEKSETQPLLPTRS
eukprot:Nk52_evm17s1020 gene=Nk52_evmTU17s1020